MINRPFIIILAISMVTFTANLGGISIYIFDEAKNSVCAREMYEANELIVPTFNYTLRTEKPVLHYYFMMLSYKMFGVNEWAARFFSAIFGILTVLLTYVSTKKFLDKDTAFLSALILLSSLHWAVQFHLAVPDPYLIFFFVLSIFSFYAAYFEKQSIFYYVMYAAIGLGVLTKGPVAIVLPGTIILATLLLKREMSWKNILLLRPFTGLAIIALITLPWYIAVTIATDWEWTTQFFLRHNVSRYMEPMEGHGGPFLLIPLFVVLGLFPYTAFLIQAMHWSWKKRAHPLLLVCLVTVAVTILFFSISGTKLPNYPAPCFPMAAVLLGHFLSNIRQTGVAKHYFLKGSFLIYLLLVLAIPIALYIVLEHEMQLSHLRYLSYYFLLLPLGGFISMFFLFREKMNYFYGSLSGTWIGLILLFFYVIFPKVDQENPVTQALTHISKDQQVLSYRRYNPAFSFYIQRPILNLETLEDLEQYIHRPNTVIITKSKYLKEMENLPLLYRKKELFEPVTVDLLSSPKPKTASIIAN